MLEKLNWVMSVPIVDNEFTQNEESDVVNSRAFALGLIVIASLYVLIMICQAYQNNMNKLGDDYKDSSYQYETESYDFRPY